MEPEPFAVKLADSLTNQKYSQVAELVEFLHSNKYGFFDEVMIVIQSRYNKMKDNNCDKLEVIEKVWHNLIDAAQSASQSNNYEISFKILKYIVLDRSGEHPWPNPQYDIFETN